LEAKLPDWKPEIQTRLAPLGIRPTREAEIVDEIALHLEERFDRLITSGVSVEEATATTLRELDEMDTLVAAIQRLEQPQPLNLPPPGSATAWNWGVDVRHAWRSLRNSPATTLTAFLVLTLSMSAATVTFSVVDAVVLRPLPFGSPDRLVDVSGPSPTVGRIYPASPQDYFAWLGASDAIESLASSRVEPALRLQIDGEAEQLVAQRITANLFDVLAVRPAVGRFFGPEHDRPGVPLTVILGHRFWVRRFAADPHIVGRRLQFQDGVREVVGILPEGVAYPITSDSEPDAYVPYVASALDRLPNAPRRGFVQVVGRLRSGASVEQARAELNRFAGAIVMPLRDRVVGVVGAAASWMLLVLLAVAIVLVVAAANVGTLFLARASTRMGEFAMRAALGASRLRLAAGLLLEGALLAAASSGSALLIALWGVEIAKSGLPAGLTRVSTIGIDARVFAASVTMAVFCGTVFSCLPAWFAAKIDLMSVLKSSAATTGGRARQLALRSFLTANVAFVSVLLVVAALVVTSYVIVTTADLGFDRRNVMLVSYSRSLKDLPPSARLTAAASLRDEVLRTVNEIGGVEAAALSLNASAPMSGGSVRYGLTIPGHGEVRGSDMLETNMVSPEYFDVMGMEAIRGRVFDDTDRWGSPGVMVINDAAARRFFGTRDPVGQVVTFRGPTTIIGVLRGVRFDGPEGDVRPAMYIPIDQEPFRGDLTFGTVVVRTWGDPRAKAADVNAALRAVLGSELRQPRFIDDDFSRVTATRRFNAGVMGVFGLLALMIGAIGIYGTVSFFVAQQVRSIGVRMALGASRRMVMRAVLQDALARVALGVCVGLATAWGISSALQAFVFGVQPTDPRVYIAVAGFMALTATLAALLPALGAARLDPLVALRHE
jgi:predicted permease